MGHRERNHRWEASEGIGWSEDLDAMAGVDDGIDLDDEAFARAIAAGRKSREAA
ncbi:MAG: hypothetical protein ACE5GB_12315 [Acidimicrobiales bacterium]